MATNLPAKEEFTGIDVTEGSFKKALEKLLAHIGDLGVVVKAITGGESWSDLPTASLGGLKVWRPKMQYAKGEIVFPASSSGGGWMFAECEQAGISGSAEPTWPATGATVTDGGAVWRAYDCRQGPTAGKVLTLIDVGGKPGLPAVDGSQLTGLNVGNGVPGVTNYIASGGKVASVSGLTITHGAIEASISGVTVKRDAGDTQTVGAKRHGLLTIGKDGTRGIRYADDPVSFIDNNTVGMWKPDGGVTCPNLAVGKSTAAVANDLTRQGGVAPADGLFGGDAAQGNGTNGFYATANLTGFPIGAAARQIDMLVTIGNVTTTRYLWYYGGASTAGDGIGLFVTNARLSIGYDGVSTDTTFDVSAGVTYLLSYVYDGANSIVYINGQQAIKIAAPSVATAATYALRLFSAIGNSFSADTIHYVEIRNAMRTPQQIAEIANRLCLPNSYDDVVAGKRKNITATLPSDTISIVYFRSGASSVLVYNDTDWQYGRRDKAFGGNRRVKLDWKSFGLNVKQNWANPFGTRRIKLWFTWVDVNYSNETPCLQSPLYNSLSYYGIYIWNVGLTITTMVGNTNYCGGACMFNGVWQTTGYIGCYAEVLEDD